MRKFRTGAALAAIVGALALPGAASAAPPSGVHLFTCASEGGGQATVPAGTPVTVWMAFLESTRGRLTSFLGAQTVTASADGVPIAGASTRWSPPELLADIGWATFWTYDAGVLARPGDTVTITVGLSLDHRVPAGRDDSGRMVFDGPGDVLPPDVSCTIVAV